MPAKEKNHAPAAEFWPNGFVPTKARNENGKRETIKKRKRIERSRHPQSLSERVSAHGPQPSKTWLSLLFGSAITATYHELTRIELATQQERRI